MNRYGKMLVIALVVLVLAACETASTVCKAAPCGCEGDPGTYGGRPTVCTKQGWQHDPR
jgi:hypothetical protein